MAVLTEPTVHRWTHQEYARMADAGLFDGRRVELIEGEVVDMAAKGSPYSTAVTLALYALQHSCGAGYHVRVHCPMDFGPYSEPEPDVAVVTGAIRDYTSTHPTAAVLIVEVAETFLRYDRRIKGSLYARFGIADYWIVNLASRELEVYRDPQPDAAGHFGWIYASSMFYPAGASLAPLALPAATVAVAELLP